MRIKKRAKAVAAKTDNRNFIDILGNTGIIALGSLVIFIASHRMLDHFKAAAAYFAN